MLECMEKEETLHRHYKHASGWICDNCGVINSGAWQECSVCDWTRLDSSCEEKRRKSDSFTR